MSSSGTGNRALLQFGVDGRAVGVEEPAADLADRTEGDQLVEHPGVQEAASNNVVDVDTAPTPKSIKSARLPASSVREISESLRMETTVEGSAYSGAAAGSWWPQHIRAAAEDELGAGLIRGGRHRAVQLDHRAATRDAGCQRVGHRDLFGPQVNPRTSLGDSRRINSAAAARPTLAYAAGRPGADVDAVACDHGFGQAEALLEFALLIGVQVVAHVRGTTTSMRTSPLALARRSAARLSAGDAEPDAISAWVRPSR
jgi:hypothetical protein